MIHMILRCYTVKKRLAIFPFPAREWLVRDIPAGDEKIANLFLQCTDRVVYSIIYLYNSIITLVNINGKLITNK
jgi:hypothetical protein